MSDWGLTEIVWALDDQVKVANFQFQRCRGGSCKSVVTKGIKKLLQGKDETELTDLLTEDFSMLRSGLMDLSESELYLASAIVKSAIKTIAVTKNTWPKTVAEVQAKQGS